MTPLTVLLAAVLFLIVLVILGLLLFVISAVRLSSSIS